MIPSASNLFRASLRIRTMNLEDLLGDVQTNRGNLHGSPSPDRDEAYRLP